jgi:hypothetical protein
MPPTKTESSPGLISQSRAAKPKAVKEKLLQKITSAKVVAPVSGNFILGGMGIVRASYGATILYFARSHPSFQNPNR